MSCESSCGPLVVTLLTGVPGVPGAEGPQGPQGPPGSLTSVTGDLSLTAGESGVVLTINKPVCYVSVSRAGKDLTGEVGEVAVEYSGNQVTVRNDGHSGIQMRALAVYE